MKDAAVLAERDEPHGTVVVAEEQTAGIGRHGHRWHSAQGDGLYMSIILRLSLPPDSLPILTMALGLATARAINEFCSVNCDIRWPNDLLLRERKISGVMVQSSDKGVLIAGIGVNVNQTGFPPELQEIATSLRIETGRIHEKTELLDRIVTEALVYSARLTEKGRRPILSEFSSRSTYALGKNVEVDAGMRVFSGVTAGLDDNGFLLVRTASGLETVLTGGVRPSAGRPTRSQDSGL